MNSLRKNGSFNNLSNDNMSNVTMHELFSAATPRSSGSSARGEDDSDADLDAFEVKLSHSDEGFQCAGATAGSGRGVRALGAWRSAEAASQCACVLEAECEL